MSADDPTKLEEQFADWLAASAEALGEGASPTLPDPTMVPAELRPRMERALAGLRLLQKLRPSHTPDVTSVVPAAPGQAEPPWKTLGRFALCRELGRGGFGIVYLARDPLLRRDVALKVPRPEAVITPQLRERFYQEARAASALEHPNLVTVYEAGEVGPVCFIVYAYCPGITLAQWLKEQTEPVTFDASARLIATLADAVEHAHQHGVVHRDLKPSNILLVSGGVVSGEWSKEGDSPSSISLHEASSTTHHSPLTTHQPKVTDFGLAKNLLDSQCDPTTRSGAILGTVSYMAPEQARGKTRAIGPPADIYALGAILYELLTGRTPFQGESDIDTLLQVQFEEPLPPARLRPRVPRDLETICLKCLQKEPHRRYASAAALRDDLQRFLTGKPILARPVSAGERLLRWSKRNPLPAALTASIALLLVVLSAGSLISARWMQQGRDRAERAEQNTKAELCRGYFAQARASRRGNDPGRRFRSLELLTKAIQLRDELGRPDLPPAALALRNELIGCLALADLAPGKTWEGFPSGTRAVVFDARLEVYARVDHHGNVRVARVLDDHEIVSVHGTTSRGVWFIRLSPDARFLAMVQHDRRLQLWDLSRNEKLATNLEHVSGDRDALDFNAANNELVVGHEDGSLSFYNLSAQKVRKRVRLPVSMKPQAVVFDPDGKRLAIGSWTPAMAIVCDAETDQLLGTLTHPGPVYGLAWTPNGKLLATGCSDGRIYVWDWATQQQQAILEGHQNAATYLAFNPNGESLASVGWDGILRLWDMPTGLPIFSTTSIDHPLRFSPDGRFLAPHIAGTQLGFWQVAAGHECRLLSVGYGPSKGRFGGGDISRDNRLLALALKDELRIWDLVTGQELASVAMRGVDSAIFFSQGDSLLTGGQTGLYRWPLKTDSHSTESLRIGPPQKLLDDPLRIFGSRTGSQTIAAVLSKVSGTILKMGSPVTKGPLLQHDNMHSLAISSDGKWVATGTHNGYGVKVWDAETNQCKKTLLASEVVGSYNVCFSPDNCWLVTGDDQEYIRWALDSWEPGLRLPRNQGGFAAMAFSPDGKMFAVETSPARVQLLDPQTGAEYATLEDPAMQRASWIAFTRDGRKLVVVGGQAHSIQIWDLQLLRAGLAQHGLDWELPRYAPAESFGPLEIKVELNAELYAQRAAQHWRRREWDAALSDYRKALGQDPHYAPACNNLAWLYVAGPARCRQPAQALPLALEAVKVENKNWIYQNTLGVVYYRLGQWHNAVTTLERAAKAERRGAGAAWDLYFLAMSYHRLGDSKKARTCYDEAVGMEKRHKLTVEELNELKEFRIEADSVLGLAGQGLDEEEQEQTTGRRTPPLLRRGCQ